jgi:hypothetical protein
VTYPFSRSTDPYVDLASQDAFNEGAPFATFARLRAEAPLAWTPESNGRGFWSVTRHADILALNRDTDLLSSAQGIRIEDQSPEEFEARKTFQESDPPRHSAFRMAVNAAFSRRAIDAYEPRIRHLVKGILDEALALESFDAVETIARRLPMLMLAQIMGVPAADARFLVEKGDALISNADPDYTDFVVDRVDTDAYRLLPFRSPAAVDLFDYANDLLERMDRGETLGVLSLVHQEMTQNGLISRDEFRNFFCLLVAAGNGPAGDAPVLGVRRLGRRGQRDDPLGLAHQPLPADRDTRLRPARPGRPRRRQGGAVVPLSQPRRDGDRRSGRHRSAPRAQPLCRLRPGRPARLPGDVAGPAGGARRIAGDRPARGQSGADGAARLSAVELHSGHQAPAAAHGRPLRAGFLFMHRFSKPRLSPPFGSTH